MTKKKKIFPIVVIVCILFSVFIYRHYSKSQKEKELKEFGVPTIAHVDKVVRDRSGKSSSRWYKYRYVFEGETYFARLSYSNLYQDEIVGHFFKAIVSANNPEVSEIILTRQVIDTSLIKEAGFFNTLIRKKRK